MGRNETQCQNFLIETAQHILDRSFRSRRVLGLLCRLEEWGYLASREHQRRARSNSKRMGASNSEVFVGGPEGFASSGCAVSIFAPFNGLFAP